MERHELTVTAEAAGCRLDKGVALLVPELSRSQIQTLAEKGSILKNGAAAGKKDTLREGDSIIITLPDPVPTGTQAENIPLEIVYEDVDLLVVNKPKGMVVHPAAGNYTGTLVNALLYHCGDSLSGINGEIRPGIVHRIDKDTSGLLIVAKNDTAHRHLAEQIKAHSFTREYEAIVYGHFKDRQFTVDAPIGRHKTDRKKMCVTEENSRHAVTHVQVLAEYPGFSHIRCRLETGRTHQIRVHMAYMGHPVVGDPVYAPGRPDCGVQGQCLHAKKIGFIHPRTGEYMEFDSALPQYFTALLMKISKE